MKNSKKISVFAPMLSVAVVGTCIGMSIMGYEAPVYKVQAFENPLIDEMGSNDTSKTKKDNDSNDENKTNEADSNTDHEEIATGTEFNLEDGIYEGSGEGFSGTVRVAVEIKDRKIAGISIISNEDDEAFFNRAKGVIDSIIRKQSTDVDVVSGATYSSRGIIEAVNNALKINSNSGTNGNTGNNTNRNVANLNSSNTINTADISQKLNDMMNGSDSETSLKDGVYYGTGTGFAGDLTVKVVIEGGKIVSVTIAATNDGDAFIEKASSIMTEIVSRQSLAVDTVSGATFSSRGIIEAAANAISQAVINTSGSSDVLAGYEKSTSDGNDGNQHNGNSGNGNKNNGSSLSDSNSSDNGKTHDISDIIPKESGKIPYDNGVYYGTGDGFWGEIKVSVEIKDHTIVSVNIIETEDDAAFFNRAVNLLDDVLEKQSTDVDTVSGATFSSNGIIEAINNALNEAKKATEQSSSKNGDLGKDDNSSENNDSKKDDDSSENGDSKKDDNSSKDNDLSKKDDDNSESKDTDNDNIDNENGKESEDSQDSDEIKNENIYRDGVYLVIVKCIPDEDEMFDEYNLSMKVTIKSDKIADITDITGDGEATNNSYIKRASQGTSKFVGMIEKITSIEKITNTALIDDVDTVSSATCTSKAIIEGCRKALEEAKIEGAEINETENTDPPIAAKEKNEETEKNDDESSIHEMIDIKDKKENEETNNVLEALYFDLDETKKKTKNYWQADKAVVHIIKSAD